MMTQFQGKQASDSQAIAELEREIATEAQEIAPERNVNFYYGELEDATEQILRYAFWLAGIKENYSKSQYKQLVKDQGWKDEDKKYLKVAATFEKFEPLALRHIEPDTIFLLAKNNKKYQPVIEQLQHLEQVDQAVVCELIKNQRKPKTPKPEPSIWRATPKGERYCQVPPIWEDDHFTGITLQGMVDKEGLTPQQIIRESLELRQAYIEGRLVEVQEEIIEEEFIDNFVDYEHCEAVDEVQPEIEEESFMNEFESVEVANVEVNEYQAENSQSTGSVSFCPNIVKTVDVPRWKLGWQEGDRVMANSTSKPFEAWCEGLSVRIVSVSGEVGKIQFVRVVRDDGETFDSFGNWIQEAPTGVNKSEIHVGDKVRPNFNPNHF
ncbi:MAG: hypothetical protein KME60_22935 [Cyanomargarita calcarea GSE-NOS-MK-12-04C]|jgi:hypothetical protein|uniref:Uncharacterized protein n=1 Tax=Cyanomargarita calcarea GSE-NOS-MK-12-04C TaxID=2839659 RepID=A0A951QR81_9CYAN|nr:hypothetical protein [Cyanomargarita calcarea GSE-NOS-MK-12-04C]